MRILNKQTVKLSRVLIAAFLSALSMATFFNSAVYADKYDCAKGQVYSNPAQKCVKNTFGCSSGDIYDSVDGCVSKPTKSTPPKNSSGGGGDCSTIAKCDIVSQYVNPFIKLLSALIGIVVVISIIIGGIQYSTSAGDPQKVSAAKNRIRNAIIALVTFLFLFALLNFLIPGGLT